MATIENNLFDIRYMDTLASGNSSLHKIDPRAKLITTLIFICMVVSLGKYEISRMVPFVIYPMALIISAELPILYLFKKIAIVAPFAILVGIFNPFFDTQPLVQIGDFSISGGWISFTSILLRFGLTVSAALILICLTGFNGVCMALEKLKVPGPFVVQLMFLYRYLFVLIEEASRMVRARSLRSFDSKGMRFNVFVQLLGQLLLRTLDRAQRIHLAMCCRGFDGHVRLNRTMSFGYREIQFILFWSLLFVIARWYNLPVKIGSIIEGYFL
ncbi:MAG: cobalt ECF transporter T component CbiQ [Proteobacteria bacterium]|nr:cobalt ECF transporter T component CbiQ [Desulfobacula sp.]MBU3954273.1 cobalt ECF transporter T component CbiQ [Pseudomonadota bacterium]MBU4131898.1 cobalt ECF transporter T component CbiQ [Pseudomonadota bacterium]